MVLCVVELEAFGGYVDFVLTNKRTMRSAILALCLAAATAMAPPKKFVAPKAVSKPVSTSSFAGELGVLAPTGFWDPAGLSKNIDQATFDRYRLLEVKHGRICQLAILGYIAPELWRWPGFIAPGLKFADVPHGIAAINAIPSLGWIQILFAIGAVDYWGFFGNFQVRLIFLFERRVAYSLFISKFDFVFSTVH